MKQTPVAYGFTTELATIDFETYSEAGYKYDPVAAKWRPINSSPPYGLPAVGASVYTEHPSAEVLCMAYDLRDGHGSRLWVPGMPNPADLFEHIEAGGLVEAHNSAFEFYVWTNICVRRYGWPALPLSSLRCSASKCRAYGLPGSLKNAGEALRIEKEKDPDGVRLLNKFSKPRNPTKNDARPRIRPSEDPADAQRLYEYCIRDIEAEAEISERVPDLSENELKLWLIDQQINTRGVYVDSEAVEALVALVDAETERGNKIIASITGGAVESVGQVKRIIEWIKSRGIHSVNSLDKSTLKVALQREDLPGDVRSVLQLRKILGASSVKKLYAIRQRVNHAGRITDMLLYCGAERTGRFAGRGPQPQNLPNSGPPVAVCPECGMRRGGGRIGSACSCGATLQSAEWSADDAEQFLDMAVNSPESLRAEYGDIIPSVSGSLRGLFCAAPGHEFICSDYSAIEAVVLAALAGEEWRLEVFRTHGKIYEMSAAKITGIPFEEFERHKAETGDHHPMRKKVGKVAELASGYQGGLHAWLAFGADKHLTEDEIRDAVKRWRQESPAIVRFWYGVEDAARAAIQSPGAFFAYRGINFGVVGEALYIQLLSGRILTYHEPRLHPDVTPWGKEVLKITFMGNNSDPTKGPVGWHRIDTYGGKLTENIVQATARDILTHAVVQLTDAGYPVAFHVHDEIISEVAEGHGSVEEFELIMATLPEWAKGWPVRAAGGWRGRRYKKD